VIPAIERQSVRDDLMTDLRKRIDEAVAAVRAASSLEPEAAVVLGTGLGGLAEEMKVEASIPFADIPHFPRSTVEEHAGELLLGSLGGRRAVLMNGRVHLYEGYTIQEVGFPVRVLRGLGARVLVLSNAAGSMNPHMPPGDIVLVADHINLMGENPLVGPNDESLGPRFPDMSEPYDQRLMTIAEEVALAHGIRAPRGIYAALAGPCLETAAEYRMLRRMGADIVGMSLVPEDIVAVHGGMRVLALSVVTDSCLPDALHPAVIEEIVRTANQAAPKLRTIILGVLGRLDEIEEGYLCG
jgi:purine-nucleoside phosphorylase